MPILAISNRKGGTGKTTVAVNLAAEFAALGRRTVLIDLDSQGHCAVGVGFRLERGAPGVQRIFVDAEATLSQFIQPTGVENLWLAPADPTFDHGSGERDDRRLRRAIEEEGLRQRFDVLVIDTPPSLDTLLVNALIAADHLLVPYVPHHLSFEGVRQLMRALFRIMTRDNRGLKILGFLPTMAAGHVRQHRVVTGQVAVEFGASRVLPAIRADIRLAEAFAAGQPIRAYAPRSRGAEDFALLTQALAENLLDATR